MITGRGKVIGHIGYPTTSFKAPMIYNPWLEANDIDGLRRIGLFDMNAGSAEALGDRLCTF